MRKLNSRNGFTTLELLICVFLLAVIIAAGFRFYVSSHQQVTSQLEVSDMQQICRNSLHEIGSTVRMAGFKVGAHAPYAISGDTLFVYYQGTQPVDTVAYYLREFSDYEYESVPGLPFGQKLYRLMKKTNSTPEAVYADFISNMNCTVVDTTSMVVTMEVCATKPDETFEKNGGFRTFVNSEKVEMRNL